MSRESAAETFPRRTLTTADGTELSVLDSGGSGPIVVVLHGLAGSSSEFLATAQALPEHRVLLLDQRGHGHSTRRPADVSREAFVSDVIALIEEVGRPVALVGQSMGAHTALLTAAARPELVSRLVLLEGGEGSGDPDQHAALGEWLRAWPVPFDSREAALAFLGDSPLSRAWVDDLEQAADGLRPRFDPDVMVRAITAVAVPRWEEWERVTAPTTVIYASDGLFTSEAKDEFIRRGRDVTRIDLAGASHDAHLDAFDGWIAALRAGLSG
ncbi:alpha/beta fold hydrolase [Rathayibacter sp. VKM Ac-2927]|uniref:alpha/beta fold hydrolase n=1 Tax=Rathayibacter sp. VKM Ac-2927 TaxID=2929478 RepID=UPI001FB3A8F9|nr:alpha/beta hydrolase [Rathayibacter sp. VKM Ac-2927]MCJ1688013.1 alpha/beta hydrolase [Rathayibacter sp. VKM Ac-2927]